MITGDNIRAALFDLDGVVFDTEGQYSVFWGSQCRLYRPDCPGLEDKIKGQTLVQRPHPMHLARSLSISKSMLMLPPGVPPGQNHGWSMAPGTPVLTT